MALPFFCRRGMPPHPGGPQVKPEGQEGGGLPKQSQKKQSNPRQGPSSGRSCHPNTSLPGASGPHGQTSPSYQAGGSPLPLIYVVSLKQVYPAAACRPEPAGL